MKTHDGYHARYSYEHVGDAMGENVCNGNDDMSLMEGDSKRHRQMLQPPRES